jgi:phosphatidylserine decarboxylase
MPQDHRVHQQWMKSTIEHVDANPKEYDPVIKEMQNLIEDNTRIRLLVNSMFDQIPNKKPYSKNPAGEYQVRDHTHMLSMMNHLITTAPSYSEREHRVGLVGLPFHAIFDWPMGTPSGFALFQDPEFNKALKKVLDKWGAFLQSPESAYVMGDHNEGWLGKFGKEDLMVVANNAADKQLSFEETYNCDPKAKNHGFKSWDDFFTRTYREGLRPVASPDDDSVIANACESTPYKIAHHVKARAKFWIKGQPYSIKDMLNDDDLAHHFIGGTIYQAFLSALSYHRWHAPVSGKIVKTRLLDGSYYSEPPYTAFLDEDGISKDGQTQAQEYLTCVATRGVMFIEADNKDIGLVCVLAIGMVEVSTCDITVKEGQHVKKGDELGMVSLISGV